MKIKRTHIFEKMFAKLPEHLQKKAEKAIRLLLQDMLHPSLHTKKVGGTKDIFEARIDYHYRFTFTILNDVITLRVVGNHDDVLRTP